MRWPGEEEEKTEKSKWWGAVWPVLCEKKMIWPGEDGEAVECCGERLEKKSKKKGGEAGRLSLIQGEKNSKTGLTAALPPLCEGRKN